MNKEDFEKLLSQKEEAFEEVINDWQSEYLLEAVIKGKGKSEDVIIIYEEDIPSEVSIDKVADYLEINGFNIIRFFANEMSGKGKSFSLEI